MARDRAIAREIAMDHLAEDPRYYDYLERMERKERRMARSRNLGVLGTAPTLLLAGGAAYLGYKLLTRKRSTPSPIPVPTPTPGVVPPRPPPPDAPARQIEYESGGETQMTLPAGAEFVVTWDPSQPWGFVAEDTEFTQAIDAGEGLVRFHMAVQLPTGGVDQVYVQAVDENDDVLGEHKFTIFGP